MMMMISLLFLCYHIVEPTGAFTVRACCAIFDVAELTEKNRNVIAIG